MVEIDKTKVFMLIEPRNRPTEEALKLPTNDRFIPQDQTQQPINAGPSDTASKPALQLTNDEFPKDEAIGYIFGSKSTTCDVLIDSQTLIGASTRIFSIKCRQNYQHFTLTVITTQTFYVGQKSELGEVNMERVKRGNTRILLPGETWIVSFGPIAQLVLKPVMRDEPEGEIFNRNLEVYRSFHRSSFEKITPGIGNLDVQASTQETPDSRILTGLWGNYTTAGWAKKGTMASITACISKTGVACCIKEALAVDSKDFLKREIMHLRRVAHQSIIQYIDRDPGFAWMVVELASLGTLEHQKRKIPFSFLEIEVVIYQALSALGHLHACEIIHHDINTENILVQIRETRQILVKVAGFGHSATISDNPGAHMGNASYLAPECFKPPPESCGAKVDVWAVAMVGLSLLFDLPDVGEVEPQAKYQAESPFAEGWRGLLKHHFDQGVERYKSDDVAKGDEERVDAFFYTLSRMFDMEPETRVGAMEACQALRDSYVPGYFLSLGRNDRTLPMIEPIPLTDAQRDDNSIFRFRQLNITTSSGPLLMLEDCYLVNVRQLIEVVSQGKCDIETATCSLLKDKRFGQACWRFKRTNELPERYVRIEDALSLCSNNKRLKPLALALWEQKKKRDNSDSNWQGACKLGLMESISSSNHTIAITQEGRMILVRAKDGHVHNQSLQALCGKQLLSEEDVADDCYISVRDVTEYYYFLSHDDVLSLGAATYTSYPFQ